MGEYWVSNAKYWCKVCKEWMADNKHVRSLHDNGRKHKERVTLLTKEKQQQKVLEAQTQREVRQELQDIEKAAREALVQDRADPGGHQFYAPAPSSSSSFSSSAYPLNGRGRPFLTEHELALQQDPSYGLYEVRGQLYMDGTTHQDQLRRGRDCEIFLEDLDEWTAAKIVARADLCVPNTTIVMTSFEVAYFHPRGKANDDDEGNMAISERGVKCDRLRIPCGAAAAPKAEAGVEPGAGADAEEGGEETAAEGTSGDGGGAASSSREKAQADDVPPPLPPPRLPEVVASTGLGGWATVSERVIDPEQEQREREESARQVALTTKALQAAAPEGKKQQQRALDAAASSMADNPNGGAAGEPDEGTALGTYRGVKLGGDVVDDALDCIAGGASVSFKKRTAAGADGGGGGGGHKKRAVRRKDDE